MIGILFDGKHQILYKRKSAENYILIYILDGKEIRTKKSKLLYLLGIALPVLIALLCISYHIINYFHTNKYDFIMVCESEGDNWLILSHLKDALDEPINALLTNSETHLKVYLFCVDYLQFRVS